MKCLFCRKDAPTPPTGWRDLKDDDGACPECQREHPGITRDYPLAGQAVERVHGGVLIEKTTPPPAARVPADPPPAPARRAKQRRGNPFFALKG